MENAVDYYQDLVLNKMQSPLQIEESLLEWLRQAVRDNIIELETHEKEFIEHLNKLIINGEFISQAIHDTFISLIEEKFTYN